ncbi:MAG: MFS transporter [bacterium]|nr:MFS transporter [bacterium]
MPPSPSPIDTPEPWRQRLIDRLEESGRFRTVTLITALAGMFATTFPVTILTISLGPIAEEFQAQETTIAWVISAPMLLSAVFFPLLGKLGDLRGHRQIFLIGFGFATLVAGLTALAWDEWSLIGLRTLAAILGGATQPTSMALIFSVYPPEQRVRAMGWWSMTGAAAPALGLALGGPLVELFGWRVVFGLQAAISLVALALAYAVLRETPRKRVRFDFAGSVALAVGIGGFMFALGSLRLLGGDPTIPLAAVGVGIFGLLAFVTIETRVEEPLLPLAFFRSRNFSATLLTNATTSAGYMGSFVIAPFFLFHLGFSATAASFLILMRTGALTIASPMGGNLGERFGERGASLFGCSVMTVGLGLAGWGISQEHLVTFMIGLILQGLGHGWSQPSITAAISRSVDESDLGIAAASNRLFGQGGAAFGITLLTLAYGGEQTPEAFATAFLVGTGLSAISVVTAVWIGASKLDLHPDEDAHVAPAVGR